MRWFLVAIAFLAGCEFDVGMLGSEDLGASDLAVSSDLTQVGDAPAPEDGTPGSDLLVTPILTVSRIDFNATTDLTSEGALDWNHYGLVGATDVNRKATGGSAIGHTIQGTPQAFGSYPATFSWTDGDPTASATTTGGVYVLGMGNGFAITVPAGTTTRTCAST